MISDRRRRILRVAGFIPVTIMAFLAVILVVTNYRGPIFDPQYLALVLQFIFVFCVSIMLAIVSARAYLISGSFNVLLLGIAPLVSGSLLILAQWAVTPTMGSGWTPNQAVTIGNLGILSSSFLLFISAILLLLPNEEAKLKISRRTVLGSSFLIAVIWIGAMVLVAQSGKFPVLFTSGGSTTWRQTILGMSGVFLAISCLMFGWGFLRSRSPVLFWYTLGLVSFLVSLIGIVYTVKIGELINWAGRMGLYVSGFFFIIAVLNRDSGKDMGIGVSGRWASAFVNDREKLASLFANMPEGVLYGKLVTDDKGKPIDIVYLDMNSAYEKIIGTEKVKYLGRRATESFPDLKDKIPNWIEPYARAVNGETVSYERTWPYTGRCHHISIYSPKKGYFVAINDDITDRKSTEDALRESETKYHGLFDNLQELVTVRRLLYDEKGDVIDSAIVDANPAALKALGAGPIEGLKGKRDGEILSPEMFALRLKDIREMKEKGKPTTKEVHLDTNGRDYLMTTTPLGEDFEITSSIDITERKRGEEALRKALTEAEESQRLLNALLENAPIGIGIVGGPPDFPLMKASSFGLEMTGRPRDSLLGLSSGHHQAAWNLLLPDGETRPGPEDMPLYRATRLGEEVRGTELVMATSDGRKIPVVVDAVPIRDKDGNIVGAINTWQDVSEQKENETAQKDYAQKLERSNAELQQFAYVSSHDLQEPLRMVVSYLTLLERKYKDTQDPQAQEYIKSAMVGGLRMRQLIDDLLEYSRLDSRAKEFAPVNMNEVLERTIKQLKVPMEESKADIFVGPLPSIMGDEVQLVQLIQNLIGNSIKFRNEERPIIHVSAELGVKDWTFKVRDNGIGLNTEYADKIFQMFQRLHSNNQYPGSGVGLAIAKKIVERHGGRIWVESEEGKGATFLFTIPKMSK